MKFPVLKIVLSLSVLISISACGSNSGAKKKSSPKDAEKVIDKLHGLMQQRKYSETHTLFSSKFTEVNSWKDLDMIYKSSEKLGDIKEKEVTSAEVTPGPDETVNYNLMYRVTRTNVNSTEQYRLVSEGNAIKIVSLKILSDAN